MELRDIVNSVEGARPTLALCNVDAPTRVLDAVGRYFEPRHLTIRRTTTSHGLPKNVAILHDGDEFAAASALGDLYAFADPAVGVRRADDLADVEVPAVVRALDDTTFSDYGKERMVVASREIEKRAWRAGDGVLRAGFQRLSLVASQRSIYHSLAETDLDVHVYGRPDADSPDIDVTAHGIDAPEIGEFWFVVYDGNGRDDDKAALLARETAEDGVYRGFWTYQPDVVDAIQARVQELDGQ